MRIPAILRCSTLALSLVVAASGCAFAASSDDRAQPRQQQSFWPQSVEPAPDMGLRSTGPNDQEDRLVDPRGFLLGGWSQIKYPPI